MTRRRWPSPSEEWTHYDRDDAAKAPQLNDSERKETARFEAIDGTPLIRISDVQAVPFGFQSARTEDP